MTTQQTSFLNTIGPMAIKSWNDTHIIIPSITIAQGILESSWGKSALTVQANNLFGIKATSSWKGATVTMLTTEYYNGVKTKVNAAFKKYNNWQGSIDDHTAFLSKPRYASLQGVKDFKTVANLLYKCGYATDPQYSQKIINVVNSYKLDQYDKTDNTQQAAVATNDVLYAVQVGCYSVQRNAATMQRHLATYGYNGYIVSGTDGLYRVQVGAFSVKANADRVIADLKARGLNAIVVQKKK